MDKNGIMQERLKKEVFTKFRDFMNTNANISLDASLESLFCLDNFSADKVVPNANNWFFIISSTRTGGTYTYRLLNSHPEIYCTFENETHAYFTMMFKFNRFLLKGPMVNVLNDKSLNVDFLMIRNLMEAYRTANQKNTKFFGDKTISAFFYPKLTENLLKIFPGAFFYLSSRPLLDWISSVLTMPFCQMYIDFNKDKEQIYENITELIKTNIKNTQQYKSLGIHEIKFEDHYEYDSWEKIYSSIFNNFGLSLNDIDKNKFWENSNHKKVQNRWKSDPIVLEYMEWCKIRYSGIYDFCLQQVD